MSNQEDIQSLIKMTSIPKGEFVMGAKRFTKGFSHDEVPRHRVEITRSFYVGTYPVTQQLWESVTGFNPSTHIGENRPVEHVSWFHCIHFCNKLSEKTGKEVVYTIDSNGVSCNWKARGYRLLTEAEWEYCAKADTKKDTLYYPEKENLYSGSDTIDEVSWFEENSNNQTHPVGQKKPNNLGLYDMSGNVREWVWDWYGPYSKERQLDPRGPLTGKDKVSRGGSYELPANFLRVSNRFRYPPKLSYAPIGLRIAL
mgnify:CR=1 FL=1